MRKRSRMKLIRGNFNLVALGNVRERMRRLLFRILCVTLNSDRIRDNNRLCRSTYSIDLSLCKRIANSSSKVNP